MQWSRLAPHSLKNVPVLEGGRQQESVFPTLYRMNTFTQFLGLFVIFELLFLRLLRGDRITSYRPI